MSHESKQFDTTMMYDLLCGLIHEIEIARQYDGYCPCRNQSNSRIRQNQQ